MKKSHLSTLVIVHTGDSSRVSGQGSRDATTEDKMTDAKSSAVYFRSLEAAVNAEVDGWHGFAAFHYKNAAGMCKRYGDTEAYAWCMRQATRCDVAAYRPY